jgi:tRNA-modifying protein YgfZ
MSTTDWNLIELGDLGVLRLRGPDGVRFLQGQLSNDVEKLSTERSELAGYHNPQGRTIALLRLVQLGPEDVLAILPRELIAPVASRLGKFVLRAKVKIADESAGWRVAGLVAPHVGVVRGNGADEAGADAGESGAESGGAAPADVSAEFESRAASWAAAQFEQASVVAAETGELSLAAAQLEEAESVVALPTASALMLPDAIHAQAVSGSTVIVRMGMTPARWLLVAPAGETIPLAGCVTADRNVWRLFDVAAGEPQVYAAASEEFVAQMLNLDVLGAIAFDKGCYTGQEVIARAHYRGRVKRRLQRFVSRGPARLAVGQSGQLSDGRAFKVVEAALLADGRCEFLAVAPMAVEAAPGPEAPAQGEESTVVGAEVLPLPYPLPD